MRLTVMSLCLWMLCTGQIWAWDTYGGEGGQQFAPFDQINPGNLEQLEVAWHFRTGDLNEGFRRKRHSMQTNPLYWNGLLFVSTSANWAIAIDAESGQERWRFDAQLPKDIGYSESSSRGVSLWHGVSEICPNRLFLGTLIGQVFALDAITGEPCTDFGENGRVDLTVGVGEVSFGDYGITSPPAVIGDQLIVGSAIGDNRAARLERGLVRALDVRTGQTNWSWDPIPVSENDPQYSSWADDSALRTGAANVWPPISVDAELNLVFVSTGSPSPDFYGGERLGDNHYANSLVALNAETGERAWHFQFVHHSVWDYDPPAAPNLIDIIVDGEPVKAVAQITKQGFTFVFDRETGEPVWPIEERVVPQSTVPGEQTSPTQPFPTKPPLFLTNGATEDDLIDFTPELRAEALEIFNQYHAGPLYTPPAMGDNIIRPGWSGGANWWGAAFDPETQRLYVPSWAHFSTVNISPPEDPDSDLTIRPRVRDLSGPQGLPLFKPPYSQLVAFDMNEGSKLWHIPVGDGPADHPALQGLELPPMGNFEKLGGPLLTKTLLFIGQGFETNRLGVYDKDSGEELWWLQLPARFHAAPITYMADGKQFLVFALGGGARGETERLMALALP